MQNPSPVPGLGIWARRTPRPHKASKIRQWGDEVRGRQTHLDIPLCRSSVSIALYRLRKKSNRIRAILMCCQLLELQHGFLW
jgi:hypothetical protein